jgi:8-oxo-dGTP pyrophosphatase MutT (NUDIX family)
MSTKKNASMVGIISAHKILLCSTKKNPEFWQPVGGGQQGHEDPRNTAMRELWEETGVVLGDTQLLKERCVHPSKTGGKVTFYTVEYSVASRYSEYEHLEDFLEEQDEIADFKWVTPADALARLPMMSATKLFLWQLRYEILCDQIAQLATRD